MATQVSLLDGALASAGTLAIQTNGTTSAITISSAQVATFVNNPIMTGLTASRAVFTDGSKGLTSNAITGTGNVVMSASPTLTGTVAGASLQLSSLTSGRVTYAGSSGLLQDSANLLYSGTDLTVYGITVGRGAGAVSTNTAVGASALAAPSTSGGSNIAIGYQSLGYNSAGVTGAENVGIGYQTLGALTSGYNNIAVADYALRYTTTGANNVAVGMQALQSNTTASNNTAVGYQAGYSNVGGGANHTFVGYQAGYSTTGGTNAAFGAGALYSNTTGDDNTAIGSYRPLYSNTTGSSNVAVGRQALQANTTASNNTAVGYQAAYSNVTGQVEAFGYQALYNNTGNYNQAFGYQALNSNTSGSSNTAMGRGALQLNTTGSNNIGIGFQALVNNTTASYNTAVGYQAGYNNTTGSANTFVGDSSGYTTSTGLYNAGFGRRSLYANTTGSYNTALGPQDAGNIGAMAANTTGGYNVGVGAGALGSNTTASYNTALGYQAGYSNTGDYNTYIGGAAAYSSTSGTRNTFIGYGSGTSVTTGDRTTILGRFNGNQGGLDIRTASNYIVLSDGDGNPRGYWNNNGTMILGDVHTPAYSTTKLSIQSSSAQYRLVDFYNSRNVNGDENLRIQLGSNCSTTSSYHIICTTGGTDKMYVYGNGNIVNANNSYGALSDIKLKENITDATPKLADLMQVKVRNYHLKSDPEHKQLGVIAQELEQVFPAMIDESPDTDAEGNDLGTTTKSVKYSVFVPMLIKAIQELKAEFDAYKATHP